MSMTRKEAFDNLANHAWQGRVFKMLSADDIKRCHDFLDIHQQLSHDQFIMRVNRMFLDQPDKPKTWTIILELLTSAMSASRTSEVLSKR